MDTALPGKHTRMLYDSLERKEANVLAQLRTGWRVSMDTEQRNQTSVPAERPRKQSSTSFSMLEMDKISGRYATANGHPKSQSILLPGRKVAIQ